MFNRCFYKYLFNDCNKFKEQFEVDALFRDCYIDSDGTFNYRELAHIMKYGSPDQED